MMNVVFGDNDEGERRGLCKQEKPVYMSSMEEGNYMHCHDAIRQVNSTTAVTEQARNVGLSIVVAAVGMIISSFGRKAFCHHQ
jgi:hypothetical protein